MAESLREHRDHLRALDGLRGIAVLMVLWGHSKPIALAFARVTGFGINSGYLGVEIFFVLSGFLITRILLADREQGVPLRYFLARRALRIFPIYYLMLAVAWLGWRDPLAPWAAAYTTNYYAALYRQPSHLLHTWSLAVEEHFYVVWPILVCLLSRTWARRVATWVFPAIALGSAALILAKCSSWKIAVRLVNDGTLTRMMSLGLGAALAFHEDAIRTMGRRGVALCVAVVAMGMLLAPGLARVAPMWLMPRAAVVVKLVAFTMMSVGTLALVVRMRDSSAWPMRILRAAWLRYVGRISYGLYLYHFPIFVWLGCHAWDADVATPMWKNLAALALTLAVSAASFAWIESPILKFKARFSVARPGDGATLPNQRTAPPAVAEGGVPVGVGGVSRGLAK